MSKKPLEVTEGHVRKLANPRRDRTKEHKLIDIVVIAMCAIICGAEDWADMGNQGNSKLPWLKT